MIDIEKLANKHDAKKGETWLKGYIAFNKHHLQAFADEYAALVSGEPFRYWHVGKNEDGSDFFIEDHSGKANPINTQLQAERDECVAYIKKLERDMHRIADTDPGRPGSPASSAV